jgi:hypothetical protein
VAKEWDIRVYTNSTNKAVPVVLSDGQRFASQAEFSRACGYRNATAIPHNLRNGLTYNQMAIRRGVMTGHDTTGHGRRIKLSCGKQFRSISVFATACGFATHKAVLDRLSRGLTPDQIAGERLN